MSPPQIHPTVFYSWQSDLPKEVCRNFICDAVERAAKQLCADCAISQDPRIDRDTQNEPGSPDIVKIIERKIELAKAFVGDVSLVGKNVDGPDKWLPNASVATETGYALACLGERRVVLPFNAAFGDPNDLPFDLRNRRVLQYELSPRAANEVEEEWLQRRLAVRKALVNDLVAALRAIFETAADGPPPTTLERHTQMLTQQALLAKRIEPSALLEDEQTVLRSHLSECGRFGSGSRVIPFIAIGSALLNPEAERYAAAIADCCTAAGWTVMRSQSMLASVSGLVLAVRDPSAPPDSAVALLRVFGELGIDCRTMALEQFPNQTGFQIGESPHAAVLLVGNKL